jgi:hypothetical protein
MPTSSWCIKVAHIAPIVSLGIGLLVVAGCGPPETGSIKLPEGLKRPGPKGYRPVASQAGSPGPAPSRFAPPPKTRPGRRRGG